MEATATVFNIERFATEDGPGIRTVVFLKGCGLRCKWCANPESQETRPQILCNTNLCVECGRCAALCPRNAIENREGFGYITDDSRCTLCGTCVQQCYLNARSVMGTTYTVSELLEILLRDRTYYERSGGGITFSGGEPLLHEPFLREITRALHEAGLPVLVETCGFVGLAQLQQAAAYVDAFFYDVKHMDPEIHRQLTGSDNRRILDNLRWLAANYDGALSVRYPYIPQHNDDPRHITAFLDFVQSLSTVKEVWFLPYHRLGIPKYKGLGRVYPMGDRPSLKMADIAFLKEYQRNYSFDIKI